MKTMSRIIILVTFSIIVVSLFIIQTYSFAAEDTKALLSKDIASLREEIRGAQGKLNRAKSGETIEKITIPISIKNMQKILGTLSKNAEGMQGLSGKVKGLNNSLNSLEVAKNKNDMQGARRILREMSEALTVFEKDVHALPGRDGTPSTPTARKPVTQPGPPPKGSTPPGTPPGKGPQPMRADRPLPEPPEPPETPAPEPPPQPEPIRK